MLKPLLNRDYPKERESFASYIYRLHRLNYYESMTTIERICQFELRYTGWDNDIHPLYFAQQISQLARADVEAVYQTTPHALSKTLTPPDAEIVETEVNGNRYQLLPDGLRLQHLWDNRHTQYCPLCLQEELYHQLGWSLVAVSACTKHKCLLWRNCSVCGASVSVLDVLNNQCPQCQSTLSQAPIIDLTDDPEGLLMQAKLSTLLLEGQADSTFAPNAFYHLLYGLAKASQEMPSQGGFYQPSYPLPDSFDHTKTALTPKHLYVMFATAYQALSEWPDSFHTYLHRYRQNKTGHVQQEFGRLYMVWLERNWRHSAYQSIQDAFDDFLCQNYVISPSFLHLRRVRENPALMDRLPCMTEAEASRMLGLAPETVKRLVILGQLKEFAVEENGRFNLIDRESVTQLLEQYQSAITLTESATFLGISERVVIDCVKVGLLEAVRGPEVDESLEWLISSPSCNALYWQLEQATTRTPFPTMIRLQKAIQMVSAHNQKMVNIIERILKQKIKAFWVTTHIRDIAVSPEDIEVWLSELQQNQPLVSRYQFAQRLGIKRLHIIDTWIANGLLEPVDPNAELIQFTNETVEQFLTDYIWTEEAGEIMKIGKLTVQKWARNGRLHPVSGRGIDGLHRYLFRRSEMERFRPENRATVSEMATRLNLSKSQIHEWIRQGKLHPVSGKGIDNCKHYLFLLD